MDYQIPQVWQVNRNLPMPLFKQVAENIKWTIFNGNIKAGTKDNDQHELIKWADVCFPNHPCENTVLSIDPNKPIYFFGEQINAQSIGILQKNLSSISIQ